MEGRSHLLVMSPNSNHYRTHPDKRRRSYVVAWGCATLACIFGVGALQWVIGGWGRPFVPTKAIWWASYIPELLGVLAFPLLFALTAVASSKGRPKGRIGFLSLLLTVSAFVLWVIDVLS